MKDLKIKVDDTLSFTAKEIPHSHYPEIDIAINDAKNQDAPFNTGVLLEYDRDENLLLEYDRDENRLVVRIWDDPNNEDPISIDIKRGK